MRNPCIHSYGGVPIVSIQLLAVVSLISVILGCQVKAPSSVMTDQLWDEWAADQVLDAKTGLPVPMNRWLEELSRYDAIYLGEEHDNRFHIDAALTVLRSLLKHGRRPVLAMEMFGWDGQPALDDYIDSKEIDRPEFLERALWKQNWGGAFESYEPLAQLAKDRHLPLLAMNPPKPLIRQVVKQGLAQARQQAEWSRWGMQEETIVDDPAYRSRILSQIQACHGGGSMEDYQTMYEASMVRDEGMAKTLAAALTRIRAEADPSQGPVVSYTGGGHVQYRLPVPNRVARRVPGGLKQVTVYLATFETDRAEELRQAMQEGIADYVWLTAQGAKGPPRQCR
ncbi:MAG: exported protein of unknown function [Nitrospira sp.]|jgi:uncharacterized iron-regulated protein|nr:exported protein of unknown function [Nitrospira sp.]